MSETWKPTVELTQAFLWTCEDCGRDNFERAITVDPKELEFLGVDAEEIVDLGGDGVLTRSPDNVVCSHCGSRFETTEG